jgi:hypothetical protein
MALPTTLRRLASSLALLLASAAASAAAQTPDEEARNHMREGQTAFAESRFGQAEEWFERAYALRPSYDVASNLAVAEQAQGKHREAATHFAAALRLFPATAAPDKRRAMEERFAMSSEKVGAIRLTVNVDGAEIFVGGQPVAKSPVLDPIFVEPGEAAIEARLGPNRAAKSVTAVAGAAQDLRLELPVAGAAPAGGPAGGPPAMDGASRTTEDPGAMGPVVAGVGFGLGGAGVVVAVVLTVLAGNETDDARALESEYEAAGTKCPGGCPELQDAFSSADSMWNVATGVWVGAGAVVLGATIATAALYGGSRGERDVEVAPVAGDGTAGLLVRGRF